MGGDIVARAIVDGGQTWRLFQPFDLVWAGGRLGRAAVQTAYWYQRARERAKAFLARRAHPVHLPEIEPIARRCRLASRPRLQLSRSAGRASPRPQEAASDRGACELSVSGPRAAP